MTWGEILFVMFVVFPLASALVAWGTVKLLDLLFDPK